MLELLNERVARSADLNHLPTQLDALDEALYGGLPLGTITELVGAAGVGKTQVSMTIFKATQTVPFCFSMRDTLLLPHTNRPGYQFFFSSVLGSVLHTTRLSRTEEGTQESRCRVCLNASACYKSMKSVENFALGHFSRLVYLSFNTLL